MPCIATRHVRVDTLTSDFNLYVIAIDFILLSAHSIHFTLYYGSRCLFTLSSISISQLVNFLSSLLIDFSTVDLILYQLCHLFLSQNMIAKPICLVFRSCVFYLFIHLLSNPFCISKNPESLSNPRVLINVVMMLTCYLVPGPRSWLSFEPRILVGYAGTKDTLAIVSHCPVCFNMLQVLFIIVFYLVLVVNKCK